MHFQVFVVIFAICGSLQINAKPLDDRGVIERLLTIAEHTLNLSERLEKLLENCENRHQPTTIVNPVTSPPTTPRHPPPITTHPTNPTIIPTTYSWTTPTTRLWTTRTTRSWTTPRYSEPTPWTGVIRK